MFVSERVCVCVCVLINDHLESFGRLVNECHYSAILPLSCVVYMLMHDATNIDLPATN